MSQDCIKKFIYFTIFVLFFTNAQGQNQKFWTKVSDKEVAFEKKLAKKAEPLKSKHFKLDINALKSFLNSASKSNSKNSSNKIIEIPNSDGGIDEFSVSESSILEPNYQKKHPEIRTYFGQNIKNPSSIIRFSITPKGFHAITLSSKTGTQFIDPDTQDNTYVVYNKYDLPVLKNQFECLVNDIPTTANKTSEGLKSLENPSDSKLRTFRLALASTTEYSEFHWKAAGLTISDSEANKKAAVLAAMVTTMNRVNAIYQRDLAIKMELVDNTNIIFIDSDNLTNDNAGTMLDEIQGIIDPAIGNNNYDIGHVFSTSFGGIATLNSPCNSGVKAKGVTGSSIPMGDAFDVDFVCHEMGHQFGSTHTFNGNTGNCSGQNRNNDSSYEPGSGTTIMAYAGICSPQNVQEHGDAYFHQKSIQMIWDNITKGFSTCGQETVIANKPPIANAGPDYTIPILTPFKLVGNSSDPDGTSTHTYTWEQYDLGPDGIPLETNITGPLFRSFEGTNNPIRYIPRLQDYTISNQSTTWEKLPSVNRTITFALTVRDNNVVGSNGGGQTDVDFTTITANNTTPFTVVTPNPWSQGSTQNIQWNVGQTTDVNTINCQKVNIKLSIDGGLTFPITIVSGTPNDGSFSYTVPALANTTQARILVEAADNIFYNLSDNFILTSDKDFFISNVVLSPTSCGATTATYTFDYVATNGFSQTTTFSASGLPSSTIATFSPATRNTSGSVTMTISNLDGVDSNNYNITLTATNSIIPKNTNIIFPYYKEKCKSLGTTQYDTSTTSVEFNTINNISGKVSGYDDYTSTTTKVIKNSSHNLTVKVNTAGEFKTHTIAWIDWNQNCNFNDPGEEYDLGSAINTTNGNTSNSPLPIVIPNSATEGNTIMRISTKYFLDGLPTSCEVGFDGEVEDYTLNISPVLSVDDFDITKLIIFPNPNKGEFTIKFNDSISGKLQTEIYDIRGRAVFKNIHNASPNNLEEHINIKNLESGMYILIVSDGKKSHTEKLIIN